MMYDFQTMRYASPMLDLTLLLYVSASHDLRSNHFNEIFDFYCKTLVETFATKVDVTLDEVPSYLSSETLLKEYALCLPNAIMIAASFLPLLYVPIEEGSVFAEQEMAHEEIVKDTMERGGASLDAELGHMMIEFYQLCNKFDIEFN